MAAALSSSVSVAARPAVAARRPARQARAVRAQAAAREDAFSGFKLAAAGVAAGLLMSTGPANAGVQLVQPETKKVFQADASAPKAPKEKKEAAVKKEAIPAASFQTEGLSAPQVAIPSALASLAGFTFIASKWDIMEEGMVKDSTLYAGYEPTLKADGGPLQKKKTTKGKKKGFF